MSRQFMILALVSLVAVVAVTSGCQPQQPFYFHEDGDLSHYLGEATNIEYPDVETCSLDDVEGAVRPLTLENPDPENVWELCLEEAVSLALRNAKVIKNLGGVSFGPNGSVGEPSSLTQQPAAAPTMYDPALAESDPRFGVEGALSAFDAQFTTSAFWEKIDQPQNVETGSPFETFRPTVLEQDLGTFQAQLSKLYANGSVFSLTHNVQYEWSNVGIRQFPSDWRTNIEAQFRQPLLRGNGTQFNRIAGPGAIPGFYNGVIIARIRTDIALADFEAAVRNLVRDTERAYWELYYAYRRLDAVIAGRDSALQTWRQAKAAYDVGGVRERSGQARGSAQDEAQARQQFFLFRSTVEQSLDNLYRTENNLRYIMGLAATDGRLIRPSDEPTIAKVRFDWFQSHVESIARTVELRQQKWRVKQREMELIASKNFLLPRLDATGRYRWLGWGDDLIDPDNSRLNAFGSLTDGNFQEWQLGLEMEMTLGFRRELAGVRNAQLLLARERTVLQEQELEVSHQLASAIRELEDNYTISQTNYNRYLAARDEVDAVLASYEQGTATLDLLLDAQRRLAEAENDFYRSVVDYNLAILTVHYRKGSLLEYNGVHLAEGPWPAKAYFDALRRARARDASLYFDYGYTRPNVMSRGPIEQAPTGGAAPMTVPTSNPELGAPMPAAPEVIPAPTPIEAEGGQDAMPTADKSARRTSQPGNPSAVAPRGGRFDLGQMDLNPLASRQAPAAVRQASFVEPAVQAPASPAPSASATPAWKTSKPAAAPRASTSRTAKSSSGWKSAQ